MNVKKIVFALLAMMLTVSCNQDDVENFDHAAQYEKEKVIINTFLETNYYDAGADDILELDDEKIGSGEISLKDDPKLQELTASLNGVDYIMYSYVSAEGTQEHPDSDDKINIAYHLTSLTGVSYQKTTDNDLFLEMSSLVEGWKTGLTVFKGGESKELVLDKPREYFNAGKGFMFIPSGLGYKNTGSGAVGANQTLVFKIELKTVIKQGTEEAL